MNEDLEIEISEDAVLQIPKKLYFQKIESCTLAIASQKANWIAMFNEEQEKILKLLIQQYTLKEILKVSNEEDFNFLISQIIDRNFFESQSINFNSPQNEALYIYLTNNCNLACRHCYMNSGKPKINELQKEDWFKIILDAVNNGIKSITFTGGEVLKYDNWFEVVKFSKDKGLTVTILTNGILWDEEKIKKVKNYIDEVQISLDGTNEELNSIVRGKGNFNQALENIKIFVKEGVKTVVATTPTLENIKEVEKNYLIFAQNLLKELNSENLYFKISQKLLNGRKVNALIKEQAKEYFKITDKLANELYPNYTVRNFINNMSADNGFKNCGYGGISISSDGNFYLCNRIENLQALGNKDEDFESLVKKANFYYEISSVDNVLPCKFCEIKYICGGGCRIDDFKFKGNHKKIDLEKNLIRFECNQDYKDKIYRKMLNAIKFTYEIF